MRLAAGFQNFILPLLSTRTMASLTTLVISRNCFSLAFSFSWVVFCSVMSLYIAAMFPFGSFVTQFSRQFPLLVSSL